MRVADAGSYEGSVRARSGLGQAETEVQARARMRRATAGQRYWRLSRAGRNSSGGSDGGDGGWKAQGTAPPPPPPPPGLNRLVCGNRKVSLPIFAIFSEFGPNQVHHLQIKFQGLNIDIIRNIIRKIIIYNYN